MAVNNGVGKGLSHLLKAFGHAFFEGDDEASEGESGSGHSGRAAGEKRSTHYGITKPTARPGCCTARRNVSGVRRGSK